MSDHDTIEQVIDDLRALGERGISTLCEEDRKMFASRDAFGELRDRLKEVLNGDNHYMVYAENSWNITGDCGCGNRLWLICNYHDYAEQLYNVAKTYTKADKPEFDCPDAYTVCIGSNPPAVVVN